MIQESSGEQTGVDFRVRDYEPGDEHGIQELFRSSFGKSRSIEHWYWRFRDTPTGPSDIHLLVSPSGEIVGHLAHMWFPTFVAGQRVKGVTGGDAMVKEGWRRRGGLGRLTGAAPPFPHEAHLVISFPSDRAAELLTRHDRGLPLGRMPQWVRWHSLEAVEASRGRRLPAIARPPARLALRIMSSLADRPRARLVVEAMSGFGEEVDELAAESARYATAIRVRDRAYLTWRWVDQPHSDWSILGARSKDDRLAGLVVFGVAEELTPGITVGRIVDVLARDAASLRALVLAASTELRRRGCGLVAFEYLDPRPWATRTCYRSGFLPRGIGPNVLCRWNPKYATTEGLYRLDAWYLTRGDTDIS